MVPGGARAGTRPSRHGSVSRSALAGAVLSDDLAVRKAERTYQAFGPVDDDFHDESLSDRWWETETCWFSWNVPERGMGGWTYCQARPNANICNGGAWEWDGGAAYP